MEKYEFDKLKKVVENNYKWPLILENITADYFPNAVVIPSSISSSELGVIPGENGDKIPMWLRSLLIVSKRNERPIVVIDRLDEVSEDTQEEFYGLLKMKSLNGFDLPTNTQFLITVSDVKKVSKKITALSIIYKAES